MSAKRQKEKNKKLTQKEIETIITVYLDSLNEEEIQFIKRRVKEMKQEAI